MQLHAYMASYAKLALFMEHAMFFALNILIHFNIDISMKGDIEMFFFSYFMLENRVDLQKKRRKKYVIGNKNKITGWKKHCSTDAHI